MKRVIREYWEEALALKVKEQQRSFVPSIAVSLAKVYIKTDVENIVYVPCAIFGKEIMVRQPCLKWFIG
nr:hypothetical protein [Peribacillus simplex]